MLLLTLWLQRSTWLSRLQIRSQVFWNEAVSPGWCWPTIRKKLVPSFLRVLRLEECGCHRDSLPMFRKKLVPSSMRVLVLKECLLEPQKSQSLRKTLQQQHGITYQNTCILSNISVEVSNLTKTQKSLWVHATTAIKVTTVHWSPWLQENFRSISLCGYFLPCSSLRIK